MLKEGSGRFIAKHKNGLISLLLCIFALVVALLIHPMYETNDDLAMEALLYGSYGGGGTSFLVFLNRILGIILLFLSSVIPQVNWYFVMHYAVCLFSIYVLAKTFIGRFGRNGIFISVIMIAASLETLYYVQFTKTAAIAAVAGVIGLLFALREERRNWTLLLISIGLVIVGSMIRFHSFLMVCPFLFLVYLFELIDVATRQKNRIKAFAVIPVIVICTTLLCYGLGAVINNNTPGAREFNEYNSYRSQLTDYNYVLDKTDGYYSELLMATNWMHNDPEVFTTERLEELNGVVEVDTQSLSGKSTGMLFAEYLSEALTREPMLLISLVMVIVLLLLSKRKLYSLLLFGCYIIVELYLIINGRYSLHRVDFGILFALLMSLFYICKISVPSKMMKIKELMAWIVVPVILIMAVIIAGLPPVFMYKANKEFYHSKYEWLNDAINQNSEYQYMIHPLATGLDVTRNIYELPKYNDLNGYFYMGGWDCGVALPGLENKSNCTFAENPWRECVDSNTIRLIMPEDHGDYYMKIVLIYIRDHYNVNVAGVMEYQNGGVKVYRVETIH